MREETRDARSLVRGEDRIGQTRGGLGRWRWRIGDIDRMQLANGGLCVRSHPPNASCQSAAARWTDAPQQTHG